MSETQNGSLQRCLERLQHGDATAARELLNCTCDRLHRLAHVMLKNYPRLQRWVETGDVAQNAVMRLARALETVAPASLADYYRLATLQIRRELLDLVRHHYGPHGQGGKHQSNVAPSGSGAQPALYDAPDTTHDSSQLALWTEFHRHAQNLPAEEQEVFDLVYYQALSHAE
ncbi:MAG TPA: ECF-type sigma factor, partial [Gemmataceae bacterium]|nr:ECF-type sigma factor [Gemmataceae bacterium]